jgi:hypothetical protein
MTSLSAIRECISELKSGQNGSEDIKNALYFLKNSLDEILRTSNTTKKTICPKRC